VGGFSYDIAAAHSSCAVGTAKSRVARARKALREMLDGRTSLPFKPRPAKRNAINELLMQLAATSGQRA
jgi:hypothetical protein